MAPGILLMVLGAICPGLAALLRFTVTQSTDSLGVKLTGFLQYVILAIGVLLFVLGLIKLIRTIVMNKKTVQKAQEEHAELQRIPLCKELTDGEFLQLDKGEKAVNKFVRGLVRIPTGIWNGIKKLGQFFKKAALGIANEFKDIWTTFVGMYFCIIYNTCTTK